MKIDFIGTGEASDPDLGNSSLLVQTDYNLLIDVGFQVPTFFLKRNFPSDFIDAIYISHSHGDHIFGLPLLILDWVYKGTPRTKDLVIIGQPGISNIVNQLIDIGYYPDKEHVEEFGTVQTTAKFKTEYIEIDSELDLFDMHFRFAKTLHPRSNYGLTITHKDKTLGYSGDGALSFESREIFKECHALVHECFRYDVPTKGHGIATDLCEFAATEARDLKDLFLVHLNKEERRSRLSDFTTLNNQYSFGVHLPVPGDTFEL